MFHEKWGFMVIFWNFAGVPFVSQACLAELGTFLTCLSDLCVLCCVHGFSRSVNLSFLDPNLHRPLLHATHRLLHVSFIVFPARTLISFLAALIRPCPKNLDSRCKCRVHMNLAGRSPNFLGVRSRTQRIFKLRTGINC